MLPTHYDYRLVAVSVFIAICAGYAALGLAERVTSANTRFKHFWIAGGACAMGTAIWSMHYIGMLAFQLPVPVHYDLSLVLLSLIAAILASALALVLTSQEKVGRRELLLGSLAMGGGIATMHYIGMAAMRMNCTCTYNWRVVALSVVIAIVVSAVALGSLRYKSLMAGAHRFAAAVLLGVAICSMHYTGMAAAHFWRSNQAVDFSDTIGVSWLGGCGIAAGTLLLLGIAGLTSMADKYLCAQSLRLKSTEERYRILFERSLAGIYRATIDGIVIDMNDACAEMLGYKSRNEVLGKLVRGVHLTAESQRTYLDTLASTKRFPAREMQLIRTDGSTFWVVVIATAIELEDGSPAEIQGMLLNIDPIKRTETELRSAKHAAESANRAKGQFLGNMSHELRTPLNGILGMTQLLKDSHLSSEQSECVDLVRSSAEALLTIVNEVLAFSATRAEGSGGGREEFDLRELIAQEVASISRAAQQKNLKIASHVAPEVAHLFWGEPHWIQQIVSGLLNNAVKFTSQGGISVTVNTQSRSGSTQMVNVSIQDTGIGISPEKQAVIFEAFYQADNSNTRRFGGTGLGLAIVRSLTEAMGGQTFLESQIGRGSTFSALLPLTVRPSRIAERQSIPKLASYAAEPILSTASQTKQQLNEA